MSRSTREPTRATLSANPDGTFKESADVARSQRADKAKKANTKVPSGYGDRGERE